MKMETSDLVDINIEKIGQMFPNCITEEKIGGGYRKNINFNILKQMLSRSVIEGTEVYEFTWPGKKAAIVEANAPIRKTLRPSVEESKNWDTTENLYIEGDNLEVLKLLQESYLGKVKMIYIDPPYNTGNDFIYSDNFKISNEDYSTLDGSQEDGVYLIKNTDSNGRFHSDWCSMIYPRLLLAKNLLKNDGVIFISIDDNEYSNLKTICDEVFGGSNYVVTIHCQMSTTQGMKVKSAQEGNIVKNAEYILCYSKDGHKNIAKGFPLYDLRPKYDEHYSLFLRKDGGIGKISELYDYRFPKDCSNEKPFKLAEAYQKSEEFANIVRSHLADIVRSDKVTGLDIKTGLKNGYWKEIERDNKKYLLTLDKNGKLKQLLRLSDSWGKTDGFYAEEGLRKIRGDWWDGFYIDMGNVSKEGDIVFRNGKKPVRLIKQLAKMVAHDNDIILDFFSGSGTTAHATMELNADDSRKRKFIMVQLPENCSNDSKFKNICELGKERIRRAGERIKGDHSETEDLDIGFRVFKVDSSNMNDVYYSPNDYSQGLISHLESNLKEDRTSLDLLFGCILDWGLPLSLSYTSEEIDGCTIHNYDGGGLVACFDENIPVSVVKDIASKNPLRVVFRDSSFESSSSKINVSEIFKMLSPDTTVKVI